MNFLKKQVTKACEAASGGKTFLHGTLHIQIRAARNLPDMESWLSNVTSGGKDVTDSFVDVKLDKTRIVKTGVIDNDLNPVWNETFRVEVCHHAKDVRFEVRDKDHAYSEFVGSVEIDASKLLTGQEIQDWFEIKGRVRSKGELNLSIRYVSTASMLKTYEVDCYFPMRINCGVTLYQDAHCRPHMPQFAALVGPTGARHEPQPCWLDMHAALMGAQQLICITGWAVWTELLLMRTHDWPDRPFDERTLGQILVDKAERGCKVYVMVWSEVTSGDVLGEKGFMGTHDMETYNYFKNTRVNCALAPRELDAKDLTDSAAGVFSAGAYTHHQKSIICDADNPLDPSRRRLIAFVGGLDLTGGRWDTPDFELFRSLKAEHNGDFRNSNAKSVPSTQGPREPWHDIHSRVEGPIAHDVFDNFYERWMKQGPRNSANLASIDHRRIDIEAAAPLQDPSRVWNVQFFRSITSDSAEFLNEDMAKKLNAKKGRQVDASIAQAYIQAIRNADNFIYIENQYFLGSAYAWSENSDINCNHTIPCEIAAKIVNKIHSGQRFIAYIVIPMFPEGDPSSAPIQEILAWQFRTMKMMYKRVGNAIAEAGIPSGAPGSNPTDWLLFLCPGKRELRGPHLDMLDPPDEPMASVFRETLRFPIYVHSKMMIIDDAYIIVGSANINQRSMAGTRDTEMAVGCWQPNFPSENPWGDVHMFRMSLWTQHLKTTEEVFRIPQTIECVQRIKLMCLTNWEVYRSASCDPGQTPGMLLPYPINVLDSGELKEIPGVEEFPDFPKGSRVKGQISALIPQKVTT